MFIELSKHHHGWPTRNQTKIIINTDAILTIDVATFENIDTHQDYEATRIELDGYPKFTLYTVTPAQQILDLVGSIDVTSGFVPGEYCVGGNALSLMFASINYPFIKALKVFNNTVTETDPVTINPKQINYTEGCIFNDARLKVESDGVIVVLKVNTKLRLAMKYDVIKQILQPISL